VAENRREEQKLWLIVFQIKAVRTRLNLLAIQFWIFLTAAVLLGAAALIFLSAVALNPMLFLGVAILILILAAATTIQVARAALRRTASPRRAAAIADDRAALKGRLATVLALAETPPPSPLWLYLVEDTYSMRQRFEPSAVEPRWVSRSIFAPLAACLVAASLLAVVRYEKRGPNNVVYAPPTELTADLGNLDIRPADPSVGANARVFADPSTLRQLAAKLAQAEKTEANRSSVSRWVSKARQLASSLQDQVTGQKALKNQPLTLNLRGDKSQPPDNGASPPAGDQSGNDSGGGPIMPPAGAPTAGGGAPSQPPPAIPSNESNQLAQEGMPASSGDNSTGEPQDQSGPKVGSGYVGQAGSSHSAGSDPGHLFGPASPQVLGSESFRLTVDARPIDEASSGGAPAYLPPKVRVTLNSQQFPDEPLARTAVSSDDQATIKRVFER
jgi:hypothetical protein